jgi:hypothetical protein
MWLNIGLGIAVSCLLGIAYDVHVMCANVSAINYHLQKLRGVL